MAHPSSYFRYWLACALPLLLLAETGFARPREPSPLAKRHPRLAEKLDAALLEAWDTAATDEAAAVRGLKHRKATVADNGRDVSVVVTPAPGETLADLEARLRARGRPVLRSGPDTVKLAVPVGALAELADTPGVGSLRATRPPRPTNTIKTQGIASTLASAWHTAGLTGQGVKVAVVDADFYGHESLKSRDEIPRSAIEVNYTGTSMDAGENGHGNACAEILYDMAPGAQLYLIKIDDSTDLTAAKNYCIANGIDIVTCSLGWDMLNFHDGVAYPSDYNTVANHPVTAVSQALAGGVLWVNSAGNEQTQHSLVEWRDADPQPDGFLDWNSSHEHLNKLFLNGSFTIPAGTDLYICMTWNRWPLTNQDFDLRLYRYTGSAWALAAESDGLQNGTSGSYPYEEILHRTQAQGQYAIAIRKYSATESPTFVLRYFGVDEPNYFGYNNTGTPVPGSLSIPADAAAAFTVGAIDYTDYTRGPIEYFSSLGPNNRAYTGGAAVPKPDICGPDRTASATYGYGFAGTSAATPHVAAMAALLKEMHPAATPDQLKALIEANAFDLGPAGRDNTYGSGSARLPSPTTRIIGLPGRLEFGAVVTGLTATASFVITNRGTGPLTVTSITYPAGFSGPWSGTIPAGGSQTVPVTFAPALMRVYSDLLTVNGNASEGARTAVLTGTGIGRVIGLAGNLSFGNIATGQSASAVMTIQNKGNAPLTVAGIACPPGFSGSWTGAVAAGQAVDVPVTFAPAALAAYGGVITVASDRTSGGGTIACSGTGAAAFTLATEAVNGSITRTPDLPAYVSNSVVTLRAVADPYYHFAGWEGDLSSSANPATITLSGDRRVTARFEDNAPAALPPRVVGKRAFTARWKWVDNSAPEGEFAVSSNAAFTALVPGYESLFVLNETELAVTNLVPGRDYWYKVRRLLPDGRTSPWSGAMKVRASAKTPHFQALLADVPVSKDVAQQFVLTNLVGGAGRLTMRSSNPNAVTITATNGTLTLHYRWKGSGKAKITSTLTHPASGYTVSYTAYVTRAWGSLDLVGRSALTNAGARVAEEVVVENRTGATIYGLRLRAAGLDDRAWLVNRTGFDPKTGAAIREVPCVLPPGGQAVVRLVYRRLYRTQAKVRPAALTARAVMPPVGKAEPFTPTRGIMLNRPYDGLRLLGLPAVRNRLYEVWHSDDDGALWVPDVPRVRATANYLLWLDADETAPDGRLYQVLDRGL